MEDEVKTTESPSEVKTPAPSNSPTLEEQVKNLTETNSKLLEEIAAIKSLYEKDFNTRVSNVDTSDDFDKECAKMFK